VSTVVEISKKDRFIEALKGNEHTGSSEHARKVFDRAIAALESLEFPTTRVEDWKYTRVGKIVNADWSLQKDEGEIDALLYNIPQLDCLRMVFVNGYFREDLSEVSTEALIALPMSRAKDEFSADFEMGYGSLADDSMSIFTAINTGYACNGAFIKSTKGHRPSRPVHVVYINTKEGVIAQPRNLFIVEESAELDIIQSFVSADGIRSFTNVITECHVAQNAKMSIDKIQSGGEESFVLSAEQGQQARDSHFSLNTFSLKGGWIRNNSNVHVNGENSLTDLYGTYMPMGKSHVDNHTTIDHAVAHCESNELYKGVIHDAGTGVFNGKVFVRQDAQKTNAFQQNANIVMTEQGSMNSKPELEIYADDVKCSHGSTTGQFDDEALFYLMARGIGREAAKKLLINAFVADVINKSKHEAVRDYIAAVVESLSLNS
jgi:Fe-S cluster assembly protein SufD